MKTQNNVQNQRKKTAITTNKLSELGRLFDEASLQTESEQPPHPTPQEKRIAYSEYRNSTYRIVSLMAYLIGVDRNNFSQSGSPFLQSIYEDLDKNREARIIRNLCILRNALERFYKPISQEFRMTVKNIGSIPEWIPPEAVNTLGEEGVRIYKTKPDIDEYLIAINTEISNRINTVSALFPEWINWNYVKPVFLMPGGTKKEGIKKAGELYTSNRNRYPYQCWINWKAVSTGLESKGNILYTDEKFVTMLYQRNDDRFENLSLVRDAGNHTMRNLDALLDACTKCVIVVDCENSDAIKLAAAFSSLPAARLEKITKILLFDSEYTTDQWKTLVDRYLLTAVNEKASLEIEHIVVPRLNQNKSQVDMSLAVRTSREVYTCGIDSVILVSSDSDYWAMIHQLESVKFLVMLERNKTGLAIMDTLATHDIPFCFIDDFCTAASYKIKTMTLLGGIQQQINSVLEGTSGKPFNIREMMENTLQNSWITMTDKEKEAFFTRYLLHMKLSVQPDGMVQIDING